MIRANVSQTKNNLSALLDRVKGGETVMITDRDRPVAQIVPVQEPDWDDHLKDLHRRGLVNPPKAVGPIALDFEPVSAPDGGYVGALEALLEERREGR